MKAHFAYVFLVFFLKHKVTYASVWFTRGRYTEKDVYLQGFNLESSKENTIFACYAKCENNILCASINIIRTDKTCELKYSDKSSHPEKVVNRTNTIYIDTRDDTGSPGSSPNVPIPSCKKIKEDDSQAKSGVYWMKFNDPSSEPFQVFCEMTIDGGGWTLVYSYTFTTFNAFATVENAVTPIPAWPLDKSSRTWVPESTTTPISELSHSAMEFSLWKKIGNEFLVKSNITNWIACVEKTGSLVNWVSGKLACRVVMDLTPKCTDVIPYMFYISSKCGVVLAIADERNSKVIFLEGNTNLCYPIHDPCGQRSTRNHLKHVTSPGGAIYIR